jgi:hypothetical protein
MKLILKPEYLECGFGGGKIPKRKWKNVSESEWLDFYKKGLTEPFNVVEESIPKKRKDVPEPIKNTLEEENDTNQ